VVFAKFPTSLIPDEADIVFPVDATNVHFEGELALGCNDLVDREWLLGDLQWFRAKGSDGFGPIGPAIVTGLDYGSLELETPVNRVAG
jgi:2-keto-4-pentenoate hydratase/2-oxohepta-3-ene-1,7-dioic acid hydratase in catechol pathway